MEPISLPGIESFERLSLVFEGAPELERPPFGMFDRPLTRFIPREYRRYKTVTFLTEGTINHLKTYQCPKCGKRLRSAGRARTHSQQSHGYGIYFSNSKYAYVDGNEFVKIGVPQFYGSPDTLLSNKELRTLR